MILGKWIKKLAGKFYLFCSFEGERLLSLAVAESRKSIVTLSGDSLISGTATIINNSNDPSKIVIGTGCWIRCELSVYTTRGQINIGNDTYIGPDTKVWSTKNISIGNRVLISHNVNIHDNDSHPLHSIERHEHFRHLFLKDGLHENFPFAEAEIVIEDDVWIGFNATILKGVRIGKAAIIGSNTLITKDVPAGAIIVNEVNPVIVRYAE